MGDSPARTKRPARRLRRGLGPVVLAALAFGCGARPGASDPRFVSETVRLEIDAAEFSVEGTYFFTGGTNHTDFPVFYPFPADAGLGPAELVGAWIRTNRGAEEPLGALVFRDGLRFRLPFSTADSCSVRVRYRQASPERRAVYILRSTQAWGRPLERAEFVAVCTQAATDPVFNYPFRASAPSPGTYTFEASPFLPEEDLVIRW